MFRLLSGKKDATFRPIKSHEQGSKRKEYSDLSLRTLGSGDLRGAVKLPAGEDQNEWFAANTVDFFNELSLIWGIIHDFGVEKLNISEGFPPGFEYRWAGDKKTAVQCSGPEYVEHVLNWLDREINNDHLFPTSAAIPFPRTFLQSIKVMYTRMFRIYAIVYCNHFSKLESVGASSHLNTSFKHFMYFIWEFDLVDKAELEALGDIVKELRIRYSSSS